VHGARRTEWRIVRGWSDVELRERLAALAQAKRNFEEHPDSLRADDVWRYYRSQAQVAVEKPGRPEPGGAFERMVPAVASYRFSDPDVVKGHFDPAAPLLGRRMLLEIKPLFLRYLCGAVVGATREESNDARTVWGYRYETLVGHMETGAEWFLLEKDHRTGVITFSIEAHWKPGQFPNWWSRLGFRFLAPRYQRRWHREAQRRLAAIGAGAVPVEPTLSHGPAGTLEHEGAKLELPQPRTNEERA
jgi:uncharacterized protein (UPF0548 family)